MHSYQEAPQLGSDMEGLLIASEVKSRFGKVCRTIVLLLFLGTVAAFAMALIVGSGASTSGESIRHRVQHATQLNELSQPASRTSREGNITLPFEFVDAQGAAHKLECLTEFAVTWNYNNAAQSVGEPIFSPEDGKLRLYPVYSGNRWTEAYVPADMHLELQIWLGHPEDFDPDQKVTLENMGTTANKLLVHQGGRVSMGSSSSHSRHWKIQVQTVTRRNVQYKIESEDVSGGDPLIMAGGSVGFSGKGDSSAALWTATKTDHTASKIYIFQNVDRRGSYLSASWGKVLIGSRSDSWESHWKVTGHVDPPVCASLTNTQACGVRTDCHWDGIACKAPPVREKCPDSRGMTGYRLIGNKWWPGYTRTADMWNPHYCRWSCDRNPDCVAWMVMTRNFYCFHYSEMATTVAYKDSDVEAYEKCAAVQ